LLEIHPELLSIVSGDISGKEVSSGFGRGDVPSVEQIMRAAIFKEMKGYDYRELEDAQVDSRICAAFLQLDTRSPFSFQLFQKYISRIKASSLQKLLMEINKIAIANGLEDVQKLRQDTTTIESNIHYPTNNSLVWDCIKESHRLFAHLQKEVDTVEYRSYIKSAKKTYFKINNTKSEKRTDLFKYQLVNFTKTINQTSNLVKKKYESPEAEKIRQKLELLLPVMHRVHHMTHEREILGQAVPNCEKLFSIYEQHTDLIMKGAREPVFGHKVNVVTGKSNLILDAEVLAGNPADSTLYKPTLDRVIEHFGITPRDVVCDGGFASKDNLAHASKKGIWNIVFNKIVGSMQNSTLTKHIETRLKKWRSGIEAVLSNLKRGFHIARCNWKGWEHFQQKVMWSVLGYNFRVMTALALERLGL